jgi:hypothetical protein
MLLPEFADAIHYRELSGGSYRFELLDDVSVTIPLLAESGHSNVVSFRDCHNREWARLDGDTLTGRRGYAWNGATPKWWALNRWWGVPDYEATRLGTLVHDICFQFYRTHYWPREMDFAACNALFHSIMLARKFRLAHTYLGAVKDFGKFFTGEYPQRGEYSLLVAGTSCPDSKKETNRKERKDHKEDSLRSL